MKTPRAVRRFQVLTHDLMLSCGIRQHKRTEDRRILETVILPYFTERDEYARVLFVGCEWYTQGYQKIFETRDYWTLEINPAHRKYGARQHVIAGLQHVTRHFAAEHFDLIVCNGVFGWGLNDPTEIDQAFQGCHACLRPGGVFLLGWNDTSDHCPVPLEEIAGLQALESFEFPPFCASHYLTATPNRHVFSFYRKPLVPMRP